MSVDITDLRQRLVPQAREVGRHAGPRSLQATAEGRRLRRTARTRPKPKPETGVMRRGISEIEQELNRRGEKAPSREQKRFWIVDKNMGKGGYWTDDKKMWEESKKPRKDPVNEGDFYKKGSLIDRPKTNRERFQEVGNEARKRLLDQMNKRLQKDVRGVQDRGAQKDAMEDALQQERIRQLRGKLQQERDQLRKDLGEEKWKAWLENEKEVEAIRKRRAEGKETLRERLYHGLRPEAEGGTPIDKDLMEKLRKHIDSLQNKGGDQSSMWQNYNRSLQGDRGKKTFVLPGYAGPPMMLGGEKAKEFFGSVFENFGGWQEYQAALKHLPEEAQFNPKMNMPEDYLGKAGPLEFTSGGVGVKPDTSLLDIPRGLRTA